MNAPASLIETDRLLIDRLKSGDETALRDIMRLYQHKLEQHALRLLNYNYHDAQEIVAAAWVRFARKGVEFRGDCQLATFLMLVVRRLCFNRYRHWEAKRRVFAGSLDAPLCAEGSTLSEVVAADELNPAQALTLQETWERVERFTRLLPAYHQEILAMRNKEGMCYNAIALRLGLSIGTVKSRIGRARRTLRTIMGDELKELAA